MFIINPHRAIARLLLRVLLSIGLSAAMLNLAYSQTELRAWNTHPDGYPVTEALQYFSDLIAQSTQNRVHVKVYSNAVLGDQPKAVQQLKAGELDLAELNLGPLSAAAPATKVLTLPFLFRDSTHMFRHIDGKLGASFEARLKAAGYVVLGWYDGGARSFFCVNKAIRFPSDFAGQRIRVQQDETMIEMVKLLGAVPVVIPYKDVQDALKNGKIDCAEGNLPSYYSTGQSQVAKYMYVSNHIAAPEALVMSIQAWGKLSLKDQQIFLDAGHKSALRMRDLWNQRVESARAALTKDGVQFTTGTDVAPLITRLHPLYMKYFTDPQTRSEMLEILGH
jgi:tripartite ATP-independent transporter DctP family solute receptor